MKRKREMGRWINKGKAQKEGNGRGEEEGKEGKVMRRVRGQSGKRIGNKR